ncbi:hypothetical protein EJ110_NYTH57788 [Nymphaea thermarum]|nr:hypothetical protein EJ110_NYTH57788 [Nymphaea thermarum]
MGIAARDRMIYIDGSNPEPAKTSGVWCTWFLEDNQVKTWIVNSVSPEIQPLILRKKTARDMWVVLEKMYGQKKMDIRTYQVMKTVYNLRQGSSSVVEYYGALKAKWEELDYHSDLPWHCPQDQALHVAQEWKNRVFLFLAGLNDEFEGVRSQILNSGEVSSIEDVYSCVEAEEQRRLVTNEGKREVVPSHERSALVSRGSGSLTRSLRRCTHYKKTGHTVDYCWDLHPEKKGIRGRPSSGKMSMTEASKPSGEKLSISADQLRELQAYLGKLDINLSEPSGETKANQALAVIGDKGNSSVGELIVDSGATHHMTGKLHLLRLLMCLRMRKGVTLAMRKKEPLGCLDRSTLDEVLRDKFVVVEAYKYGSQDRVWGCEVPTLTAAAPQSRRSSVVHRSSTAAARQTQQFQPPPPPLPLSCHRRCCGAAAAQNHLRGDRMPL